MARPATILFDLDLDGTLSDPLQGFARCINHALRLHGLPDRAPDDLARFIGPPLADAFVELGGGDPPELREGLVAAYRARFAEHGYAENSVHAGIPAALSALRAAGCTLAVCNSPPRRPNW